MKIRTFALIIALCILGTGCQKDQPSCSDRSALNYNPGATTYNHTDCIYSIDSVVGQYRVTIVSYPLQPSQVGETNDWTLNYGYCTTTGNSKPLNIDDLSATLDPDNFCIPLNGFQFTINDSNQTYTWAGAPLKGTCTFIKDSLTFIGTVTPGSGISYPIILKGYKYSRL